MRQQENFWWFKESSLEWIAFRSILFLKILWTILTLKYDIRLVKSLKNHIFANKTDEIEEENNDIPTNQTKDEQEINKMEENYKE